MARPIQHPAQPARQTKGPSFLKKVADFILGPSGAPTRKTANVQIKARDHFINGVTQDVGRPRHLSQMVHRGGHMTRPQGTPNDNQLIQFLDIARQTPIQIKS